MTIDRSPWKPDDIDQLVLASDFEVSGLIDAGRINTAWASR